MALLSHEKIEVVFSSEASEMAKFKLEIEIPGSFSKQRRRASIAALKKNANFNGFRKGTIPPFIMKDLDGFVLKDSVTDMIDEAVKELDMERLEGEAAEPFLDDKEMVTRFKVGEDFTFSCEISLRKVLNLDSIEVPDDVSSSEPLDVKSVESVQ